MQTNLQCYKVLTSLEKRVLIVYFKSTFVGFRLAFLRFYFGLSL